MADEESNVVSGDLSVIVAGVDAVKSKDHRDQLDYAEENAARDAKQDLEIAKLREDLENSKSDRELRETYGNRILRFLEWYAGIVGTIVIVDGFEFIPFNIPENATVALVGSTAVAAIGLVGFVAQGLFGKKTYK